jgi:hypothetical protein
VVPSTYRRRSEEPRAGEDRGEAMKEKKMKYRGSKFRDSVLKTIN